MGQRSAARQGHVRQQDDHAHGAARRWQRGAFGAHYLPPRSSMTLYRASPTVDPAPPGRLLGFTLVETVVAIGIMAVVLGILLPAIQRVRDASHRNACGSNLHQISLALQQHHDARGAFPSGMTYQGGKHSQPFLSWHARILPYAEYGT